MCERCFLDLIERHERDWLDDLTAKVRDDHQAFDLLYKVLGDAWAAYRAGTFDPCRPDAVGWVNQRIEWHVTDYFRKRREVPFDEAGVEDDESPPLQVVSREPPPPVNAMTEEGRRLLGEALAQFSPLVQTIVLLHQDPLPPGFVGSQAAWVAEQVGMTEAAVVSRYFRAKLRLKELLGKDPLP